MPWPWTSILSRTRSDLLDSDDEQFDSVAITDFVEIHGLVILHQLSIVRQFLLDGLNSKNLGDLLLQAVHSVPLLHLHWIINLEVIVIRLNPHIHRDDLSLRILGSHFGLYKILLDYFEVGVRLLIL